jgi:septum site-determining protein MinD
LIKDKRFANLFLLPAAQTKDKTAVNPDQMRELTEEIKPEFDYIIVDCPAGIEQGFRNAIAGAQQAIVVTTPEVSAVRDADRIIGLLEKEDLREPKLVLNRMRYQMVKHGDMMSIEDVIDVLAIDILGVVPEDEQVVISTNRGEMVVMNNASKSGQAYRNIVRRIKGEEVPMMNLDEKSGLFSKLKRIIGLKS